MTVIGFFFRQSRRIVISSTAAGIISGSINTVLLGEISSLLRKNGTGHSGLVAGFFVLCLLLAVFRFTSEILLSRLGQTALYDLRLQLSRQILAMPLLYSERLGAHRLLSALTDDIPTIANAILVIPLLTMNVAVVIGCLVFMAFLSSTLLAFVLGFMVLGVLGYQVPIFKAQAAFARARKDGDAMMEHFRALTFGAKELKLHGQRRKSFLGDVLGATADSFRRNNLTGLAIFSAASSWGQALVFVATGLILLVLPVQQHQGALTGFAIALLYLMAPLQVIMNTLPNLARANVALRNIQDLQVDLTNAATESGLVQETPGPEWQSLEFVSVVHTYSGGPDGSRFVLGPLDLTFRRGELVFVTGGNGSGKTTFIKLLTGLYVPESGEIRLDAAPVTEQEREAYRQYFSAVFFDFYLFEQFLGLSPDGLELKARKYLQQLQLSQKINIENGRLSTVQLSQGQRKRLALLTAYLEDRSIYVFDEWAADQDPYFKDVFYSQLLPELKSRNKTVFVISHDERFYHLADRIVKLDEGQVVSDMKIQPSRPIEVAGRSV